MIEDPYISFLNWKGKTLYVPKIRSKEGVMDFLRGYSAEDLASFPAGTWGIREPGDLWEGQNRTSSEFKIIPFKCLDVNIFPE